MKNHRSAVLSVMAAVLLILLAGCGEAAAPETAETPTETAQPILSLAPLKTDTPTRFLTPTETPTETPTFTPTRSYNLPGTYEILKCVSFQPFPSGDAYQQAITIQFCVQTVKVRDDSTMQVNVTWTYFLKPNFSWGPAIVKAGFLRTVLIDDLENTYETIGAGGAAAGADQMEPGKTIAGWYLFDRPEPGATSFRLLDLDSQISIDNIVLLPKLGTDTPTHTQTALQGTPYNEPGTYWLYTCVTHPPSGQLVGASYVALCLNTVVVYKNRTMRFNVVWKVYFDNPANIKKDSAVNAFYLEDDLGNEYTPAQYGGCALEVRGFYGSESPETCAGWFQFEPAHPGATSFRLVDMVNHVSIENIVLVPKTE